MIAIQRFGVLLCLGHLMGFQWDQSPLVLSVKWEEFAFFLLPVEDLILFQVAYFPFLMNEWVRFVLLHFVKIVLNFEFITSLFHLKKTVSCHMEWKRCCSNLYILLFSSKPPHLCPLKAGTRHLCLWMLQKRIMGTPAARSPWTLTQRMKQGRSWWAWA